MILHNGSFCNLGHICVHDITWVIIFFLSVIFSSRIYINLGQMTFLSLNLN